MVSLGGVEVYAITVAVLLGSCIPASRLSASSLTRRFRKTNLFVSRFLTYPRLFGGNQYFQPWTMLECIMLLGFAAVNVIVATLPWLSIQELRRRLGVLAVVNMVPLYFGTAHDIPATIFGLLLRDYSRVHRVMGAACITLGLMHAILSWNTVPQKNSSSLWTWNQVVFSSILLIAISTLVRWRIHFYESFLWVHRLLGFICLIGLWRHATPGAKVSYCALSTATLAFALSLLVVMGFTVWINGLVPKRWYIARGYTLARDSRYMRITVHKWQGRRVRPGQYLHLVAPGITNFGTLQSHPFMGVPGSEGHSLEMFVEMRSSFTSMLFQQPVDSSPEPSPPWKTILSEKCSRDCLVLPCEKRTFPVLLRGPYGPSVSLRGFEIVVMVAKRGCHVASFIPYLRNIAHDQRSRLRAVHLVWEVDSPEEVCMWSDVINGLQAGVEVHALPVNGDAELLAKERKRVKIAIYYPEGCPDRLDLVKTGLEDTVTENWGQPDPKAILGECRACRITEGEKAVVEPGVVGKEPSDGVLVLFSGKAHEDRIWYDCVCSYLPENVRFLRMPDWQ
ncbi:uncharacterized protein PV07_12796 [Cladophialophora immunda]|uniref:Uncharacterized protein n=1 Tax=Cladophialophora immunda TaxID=569365 RepID=A0A0D1Z267_9EURO|nr:uncharacterized protein PV07_12796 [Cladophialophora immunda]KIW21776.1 hypothetical protein PV07_12796 [Cladophialophora immunda]